MAKDDGGPAFPIPGAYYGMDLRDWFAGQVISGVCAQSGTGGAFLAAKDYIAQVAYAVADAMLAERDKEG